MRSISSRGRTKAQEQESYYMASSFQLMKRKFFKHKIAVISMVIVGLIYLISILAGFFAPYDFQERQSSFELAPPQRIRIFHEGGLRVPFVYGLQKSRNPETLRTTFTADHSQIYKLQFFVRSYPYKFWGLFPAQLHFFGVEDGGPLFLFGTDDLARDLLSRNLYAARASLFLGVIGIAVSFVLGCLFGGLSGYLGGAVDMLIQRVIEFLASLPKIPLWMAMSAALPLTWPPIRIYFMITIILSIIGWTGLARVVRGKLLQLRVEDYVMAAKIAGLTELRIIRKHLLPGFMSYLIVSLTLSVPYMIIGETALSFIGVGLRPPVVSWGVLLQNAQHVRTVALYPWLMIPALFVVLVVLCFNFVGDGLRDAADPYK